MSELKEAPDERTALCIGRCKFTFVSTQTRHTKVNEQIEENKVLEGLLLCETCSYCKDVVFT